MRRVAHYCGPHYIKLVFQRESHWDKTALERHGHATRRNQPWYNAQFVKTERCFRPRQWCQWGKIHVHFRKGFIISSHTFNGRHYLSCWYFKLIYISKRCAWTHPWPLYKWLVCVHMYKDVLYTVWERCFGLRFSFHYVLRILVATQNKWWFRDFGL